MILKKDSGDEHKFCTTLMEKTVGGIGILNSDLFSDQFFYSVCTYFVAVIIGWFIWKYFVCNMQASDLYQSKNKISAGVSYRTKAATIFITDLLLLTVPPACYHRWNCYPRLPIWFATDIFDLNSVGGLTYHW